MNMTKDLDAIVNMATDLEAMSLKFLTSMTKLNQSLLRGEEADKIKPLTLGKQGTTTGDSCIDKPEVWE